MEGVAIGNKHTWNDWHLIWTGTTISSPKAKTKTINIPGGSGVLDLSEILTGHICFENRSVKLSFTLHDKDKRTWQSVYSDLLNYCHGKKMKVVLDSDPTHYWIGRISLTSDKKAKYHSTINIELDADPYKYEILSSLEDWLWDPFNFEYDVIREYGHIVIDGKRIVTVIGSVLPYIPVITADSDITLKCNGKTFQLHKGTQKLYGLMLYDEEYEFTFTGDGSVSIDMRGGSL